MEERQSAATFSWPLAAQLACVVWVSAMYAIGNLGRYVARSRYTGQFEQPKPTTAQPGVTILRPLRGLDCNLYDNLEASFRQDYADKEIICSVASSADQAIPIVNDLIAKYPAVKAKLLIGEQDVGVNPKINNLVRSYHEATHDLLWILDANVLMDVGALTRAVQALQSTSGSRSIGLVHHVPFALMPDVSLGARIEQVFLCTTHAKMYLAINFLRVDSCVMGKSTLFRRSDLNVATTKRAARSKSTNAATGLEAFGRYLGEDNMIGSAIWHDLGYRHAMSVDVAGNTIGSMALSSYFWRRVRWIRVRKYMVTASTLVEPLTESVVCGIMIAYGFNRLLPIWLVLLLHFGSWYATDVAVYHALQRAAPYESGRAAHDGPGVAFFRAWILRELSALPIWIFAMAGDRVGWRDDGKQYRVRSNGEVEEAAAEPPGQLQKGLLWLWRKGPLHGRRSGYRVLPVDTPTIR
ncbi:glycosyltransferase family 21 protein [Mixia osmundae IAM 14324]|nr:glycosyltransferase family 21 protein [Mixia osmundae IAM 14324]KEI41010.1 glycosyltransferase family 21 protein [Mixia osmundae IAM 14324]